VDLAITVWGGVANVGYWACRWLRVPEVCEVPWRPGSPILPCVLERAAAPRHRLPYGKEDRPIYTTASRVRAKDGCDLVPFDLLGSSLWYKSLCSTLVVAQATGV
jgi:hypothetical protein